MLVQPVSHLLKIGFVLLPLFEVGFRFLFSVTLLCQAFRPQTTMYVPYCKTLSGTLHNLVPCIS